ncbi:MAG: nitroreductase [bacterium]|nr:nitroreductase [bacterium]
MSARTSEILEAIRARRSIGKMRDEAPPRETIERIVEAATWAPFHKCDEPWHFVIIAGEARARLGEIAASTLDLSAAPPDAREKVRAKERGRFARAPVVVAVIAHAAQSPVDAEENYASAAAATQNMLLAAHAEGCAGYWRTGRLAREPAILEALEVGEGERIVGFVSLGFPALEPKAAARQPVGAKTRWLTR